MMTMMTTNGEIKNRNGCMNPNRFFHHNLPLQHSTISKIISFLPEISELLPHGLKIKTNLQRVFPTHQYEDVARICCSRLPGPPVRDQAIDTELTHHYKESSNQPIPVPASNHIYVFCSYVTCKTDVPRCPSRLQGCSRTCRQTCADCGNKRRLPRCFCRSAHLWPPA